MSARSLEQWLRWQETLNPREIDLGLERVATVARRLLSLPVTPTVITVAGTNGKGSCIAALEAALRKSGRRVGAYTSPHLLRYNERIRIDGGEIADSALCEAFDAVESARQGGALSYFEFGTLAALWHFEQQALDAWLLEVGLGGRLDAVNVIDADVAVVTSIDIDHVDWLGADRDSIGREKAGVARAARPLVCADPDPPAGLIEAVAGIGAGLRRLDREIRESGDRLLWRHPKGRFEFPRRLDTGLLGRNLIAALAAVQEAGVAVTPGLVEAARGARVAGRGELLPGPVPEIHDVAHNPAAARELAALLASRPVGGATHAVLGLLADKDVAGITACLNAQVDNWYLADLPGARGLTARRLREWLPAGVTARCFPSAAAAVAAARSAAGREDRILVTGSFLTLESVRKNENG